MSSRPGACSSARRTEGSSLRRRGRFDAGGALTLVAVAYVAGTTLALTFDRAINIAAMDVTQVLVSDGEQGFLYQGFGEPELLSPTNVSMALVSIDSVEDAKVRLTASADTGIAAVDDGSPWEGVSA